MILDRTGEDERVKYVQCLLKHPDGRNTTVWLPGVLVKKDEPVRFKHDGVWSDGWIIAETYQSRYGVPNVRKQIKGHRTNTGDALPKEKVS